MISGNRGKQTMEVEGVGIGNCMRRLEGEVESRTPGPCYSQTGVWTPFWGSGEPRKVSEQWSAMTWFDLSFIQYYNPSMGNGFRGHGGWSDRRETRDRATAHILVTERWWWLGMGKWWPRRRSDGLETWFSGKITRISYGSHSPLLVLKFPFPVLLNHCPYS